MEGFPTSSLRGGVYRQMPGGLPADNGSVPGRRGRPKAGEGEPPMPKMWKPVERLAGVLAYLEVSEAGPNANLETDAKAAYPAQLDFVCTELCSDGFPDSRHRHGSIPYIYDIQESKKRRPTCGKMCMIDNFKETRKICNNVISKEYYKLHDGEGKPETGTNRDKLIEQLLAVLQPEVDKPESNDASSPQADAAVPDVQTGTDANTEGHCEGGTSQTSRYWEEGTSA